MYIATIIPIAKGIPFDTLTYYTGEAYSVGTIVTIPFGKQTIKGIIIETTSLSDAKSIVKNARFSLKKIKDVVGNTSTFKAATNALLESAILSTTPVGALAGIFLPTTLFEYILEEKKKTVEQEEVKTEFEESVIYGTNEERIGQYKRVIRSAFAAKQSVLFIAPSIRSLEEYARKLEKGIDKHVVLLHSKITKKALKAACTLIKESDRPIIIFATPSFMLAPRTDIGTIIIEEESSSLYYSNNRFKTDMRIFSKTYASHLGVKLIWGDTIPRFATLKQLKSEHLARTFIPDKLTVVPIEPYKSILPQEVMDLIGHAQKKKKKIYIFANRKGIAPLSRCYDCGTVVTCPECSLPMVLRNTTTRDGSKVRTFVCTHCPTTLPATHTCVTCGSWNITPVAIGTESIRDAVVELVGAEAVFTIDDDLTPDSTEVKTMLSQLEKRGFAIVIGTVKVLPYITQVHYSLFPFFDRQLSTPSLYTTETILRLIMECNERSTDGVLLFTKDSNFPIIKQLETQKINAIIHDELAIRQELGYPPFGSIIKISLTVSEQRKTEIAQQIADFFGETSITMLPARKIPQGIAKVLLTWVFSATTTYIEEEGSVLVAFLQSLKTPYLIEENPERFS